MNNWCYLLKLTLRSDASFGNGDGVPGEVDDEVMHDDWGFPYLGGRAIKGILVNECADILAALPADDRLGKWLTSANRLFGRPGSTLETHAILSIGDAQVTEEVRNLIMASACEKINQTMQTSESSAQKDYPEIKSVFRKRILDDFTTIRYQTAMELSGVPKEHSLRAHRVIYRNSDFEARLVFFEEPTETDLALLSACVHAFRRVGSNRNRGLGRIDAALYELSDERRGKEIRFAKLANDFVGGGN